MFTKNAIFRKEVDFLHSNHRIDPSVSLHPRLHPEIRQLFLAEILENHQIYLLVFAGPST